ncbi:unnamed protein product [Linum trigynum]|uniref:Endoplasmic reticulum transmembrane protein n=1 Tax=Linum trigynum TaxID=586398 RepID=A0AAV2FJD1_9ROSI
MIQLLFTVLFCQMAFILLLVFKTPLRKLVILGLDRLKRGRGPVVVKTVAGTVLLVFSSSVYSMVGIQNRWTEEGAVINPTDQVILANHLLEATLMGGLLFLALMIDRLHHYMRELRIRRKSLEALKKQRDYNVLEDEVTELRAKLKRLEADVEAKNKEVSSSKASAVALKKQSDGFVVEFDRLQGENQTLKNKLQSLDFKLSRSGSKKDS